MKPDKTFDPRLAAKKLLREARSGALATLMPDSGDPYCSLVNVATTVGGAPVLLLSKLAVHTKNLLSDTRASLMFDERKEGDPLEGARIMLMGRCVKDNGAATPIAYLRRHPDAEMYVNFSDFSFYRMEVGGAHLVAGFGRIVDLRPQDVLIEVVDAKALVEAEADAIAHMNTDHAVSMRPGFSVRETGIGDASASIPKVSSCKTGMRRCACHFRGASSRLAPCALSLRSLPRRHDQSDRMRLERRTEALNITPPAGGHGLTY
jgi:putative heme iron utilization protein